MEALQGFTINNRDTVKHILKLFPGILLCTLCTVKCFAHNIYVSQTVIRQDVVTKKWYVIETVDTKIFADAMGISLTQMTSDSLLKQIFVNQIKQNISLAAGGNKIQITEGAVKIGFQMEAILELKNFPQNPAYLDVSNTFLLNKRVSDFTVIYVDTLQFQSVFNSANSQQRIYFNYSFKNRLRIFKTYVEQGFLHVFPWGCDHILFITGLFFFNSRLKSSLIQSLVFTLAHTITLIISSLHIVSFPVKSVEIIIALSIGYIAVENIFLKRFTKLRLLLIFVFGLVHGLGFASAFASLNIPTQTFLTSLFGFNLGVETAQAFIILLLFFLLGKWFYDKYWYRQYFSKGVSVLILIISVYLTYQRV